MKAVLYRCITGISVLISLLTLSFVSFNPNEGMYPLTEIGNVNLREAGLKIPVAQVYNPDSVSLVNAVVHLGGCTGSFVSPEGLIVTNHHCVFGAVQRSSTTQNNYLENGFLARSNAEEIPAEGMTCKITQSYEDVSELILKAANAVDDISERERAIENKINEIVKDEEEKDPAIEAQVAEMFAGETYILFRYKVLKDVRLVYIPPRDIGEFGGEKDNWMWPRHDGDFSFVRAYTAPDGTAAEYSVKNVPYHPQKFLQVNPKGVKDGDFVFILGFPAKTYKNQPSQFIKYQYEYQLPYIQELYSWLINFYQQRGKNDPEFALKFSSKIKGLANTEKNYRGKLIGIKRMNLIEKKQKEERYLQEFIDSNQDRTKKYTKVLSKIDYVYKDIFRDGILPQFLSQLSRRINFYKLGQIFVKYKEQLQKPEKDREDIYRQENFQKLTQQIKSLYGGLYPDLDRQIMKKILNDGIQHEEVSSLQPFAVFARSMSPANRINSFVDYIYDGTFLKDQDKYYELLQNDKVNISDINDPFINFSEQMEDIQKSYDERNENREGKLNLLLSDLSDVKKMWFRKSFVPDANRTLRLTYGYIKGYSPSDAVYCEPITTLKGLIEKGSESSDYKLSEKLVELYNKKDFGQFADDKLNDVPVDILYNTDTSGGNSGSPVMDAYGRLIGVNFDRPFEATVNDYAWSPEYSRSIGVDIRYVLWVTQKIGGAGYLLEEMGISQ